MNAVKNRAFPYCVKYLNTRVRGFKSLDQAVAQGQRFPVPVPAKVGALDKPYHSSQRHFFHLH